ncbi:MAG: N-acetylneuraminate synthase family protein [Alphaproteobacteria bacterium]
MTESPAELFARLDDPHRTFLIAEIGANHNGDFDTALRLMDVAKTADADAVKFQSFLADELTVRSDPNYAMLKGLELPREWYPRLKKAAGDRGLVFFSTATNSTTLAWMRELDCALYKIASPNLNHLPLIRETAAMGRPVIMSTGMAGLEEIDEAVKAFTDTGNRMLCLLHCVSLYPAPPETINLRAIPALQARYPFPIGFSDHTMDIATPVAAVALGARAIEKHLTLDRAQPGPDHHYATEPEDFIRMGRHIRIVEQALGHADKRVNEQERARRALNWRSLHAARDLESGHPLSAADLKVVRPNDGLHPRHFEEVVGRRLRYALRMDAPVRWEDLEGDA